MTALLNTHTYDGQLAHYKEWIAEDTKMVPWVRPNLLTFQEAMGEVKARIEKLDTKELEQAKALQALALLSQDESQAGNHDTTSDLRVEAIFPILWAALRSLESRGFSDREAHVTRLGFYEQIADILVLQGPCPQGRVTRLLNYYSLIRS